MKLYTGILVFIVLAPHFLNVNSLSRKKRWLVFPKGSSLQLVYCFLVSTYGTEKGIFTVGITVGLAWEIPVDVREYVYDTGEDKIHDRDRRHLLSKVERLLNKKGDDGRNCVLRAVCESRENSNKRLSFLESLMHEIFSFENKDYTSSYEEYHNARWNSTNCAETYPCSFKFYKD